MAFQAVYCFTNFFLLSVIGVQVSGGAPEWNLLAWSLEKQKVIATVKTAFQGSVAYQV